MNDATEVESGTVDVDSIDSAQVKIPKTGNSGAKSELDQLDHEHKTFQNELGILGKLFGGRREKSGNISGLVVVVCLIMMIIAAFLYSQGDSTRMYFETIFSGLLSVVTLTLGYLFGSSDKST